MIALDTTVLVYAVGADHPLREPCRRVVEAIGEGRIEATTSVQVIQEFAHVRARRRGRDDAARIARSYVTLLSPLLRPGDDDVRDGMDLFARVPALGAFDAVLAATVRNQERITAIVSADTAFADVSGLEHLDPAAVGPFAPPAGGGHPS